MEKLHHPKKKKITISSFANKTICDTPCLKSNSPSSIGQNPFNNLAFEFTKAINFSRYIKKAINKTKAISHRLFIMLNNIYISCLSLQSFIFKKPYSNLCLFSMVHKYIKIKQCQQWRLSSCPHSKIYQNFYDLLTTILSGNQSVQLHPTMNSTPL